MNNCQQNPQWKDMLIRDGTIDIYGCTVSVIGNCIGVTPNVVVDRMKAVQGFLGNLVIWAKIEEAFPGITIRRVWSYNNDDVLANVPNVIVEVPAAPIGGTGSHWVQYLGNHTLADPWTGKVRPTSDFPNPTGYCVITGKWESIPQPADDTLPVKKTDFENMRTKCDAYDPMAAAGYKSLQNIDDRITDLTQKVGELNATNTQLKTNIQEAQADSAKYLGELQSQQSKDSTAIEEGLKAETDLADAQKVISSHYGRFNVFTEDSYVSAVESLLKPHQDAAKEVSKTMDGLAKAAIDPNPPVQTNWLQKILNFFKK